MWGKSPLVALWGRSPLAAPAAEAAPAEAAPPRQQAAVSELCPVTELCPECHGDKTFAVLGGAIRCRTCLGVGRVLIDVPLVADAPLCLHMLAETLPQHSPAWRRARNREMVCVRPEGHTGDHHYLPAAEELWGTPEGGEVWTTEV